MMIIIMIVIMTMLVALLPLFPLPSLPPSSSLPPPTLPPPSNGYVCAKEQGERRVKISIIITSMRGYNGALDASLAFKARIFT